MYAGGYAGAAAGGAPAAAWSPYTAAGWAPANPTTWALFQSVDTDRSGSVSFRELHTALTNGGWTGFSLRTTKLLIKMFDADRSEPRAAGTLGYLEFERLWTQLQSWRAFFDANDRDRSGKLSADEVAAALRSFGFNLPAPICGAIFRAYDEDGSGALGFDEFIQVLAEVNALTAYFRQYDRSGSGVAQIDYASFLSIVFATRT